MKAVVAFCSTCGGWTMFHADAEGTTGRQWTAQCEAMGDLVMTFATPPRALGPDCPQSELVQRDRTCAMPSMQEAE